MATIRSVENLTKLSVVGRIKFRGLNIYAVIVINKFSEIFFEKMNSEKSE